MTCPACGRPEPCPCYHRAERLSLVFWWGIVVATASALYLVARCWLPPAG